MVRLIAILLSKEHGPAVKAGVMVAALGGLLVYFLAVAFTDGEVRRREMPVRALLGNSAYDAWIEGQEPAEHYLHRPPSPAWVGARPGASGPDLRAPDFELPMRDGSTWRLRDHRGKVIVLNFWTVTCQPCVEEMPSLVELSRALRGRDDVELVTISTDRSWNVVRTVVPDDAPLTVLLDPDRSVVRDRFGTRLYPETWVIDPEGVIRLRVDGRRDWSSPIVLDAIESYL